MVFNFVTVQASPELTDQSGARERIFGRRLNTHIVAHLRGCAKINSYSTPCGHLCRCETSELHFCWSINIEISNRFLMAT